MSLGKPAIITDIVGNIELIENNVQGFVTPAKDSKSMAQAIVKMYDSPEKTMLWDCKSKNRWSVKFKQTVIKLKKFIKI